MSAPPAGPVYVPNHVPAGAANPNGPVRLEAAPLPAPDAAEMKARVRMILPEDAVVFMAGKKMASVGPVRQYATPALEAGKSYEYPIRIEVIRDGKVVSRNVTQPVAGGDFIELAVSEVEGVLVVERSNGSPIAAR